LFAIDPHLDAQIPGSAAREHRAVANRSRFPCSVARAPARLENVDAPGRWVIGDPQFTKPNLRAKA
jgi:hypothetical protein